MARRMLAALTCIAFIGCNGVELPPRPDGSTPNGTGCGSLTCELQPDDLLVTEILYNPAGDDTGGEWFEVYNNRGERIPTLAGVVAEVWSNSTGPEKGKSLVIQETGAPSLEPGGFLIIGQGKGNDAGVSIPVGYTWSSMPALNNSAGSTIRLKCCDGTEISKVSYAGEDPWPKPSAGGVSIQLSQSVLDRPQRPDAATAGEPKYWCSSDAEQPYDALGNRGTPATRNSACAVEGECIEGDRSRPVRSPEAGDLRITEIFTSPAGPDDYKEWVELRVEGPLDVNGLVLIHTNPNDNSRTSTVTDVACLAVSQGQYVLLGSSTNGSNPAAPDYNGGVQGVTYAFSAKQFLYNDEGTLQVKNAAGEIVDSAQHPKATDGTSVCLDEATSAWDHSTDTGQFEGTGTPGSATCTHAAP